MATATPITSTLDDELELLLSQIDDLIDTLDDEDVLLEPFDEDDDYDDFSDYEDYENDWDYGDDWDIDPDDDEV